MTDAFQDSLTADPMEQFHRWYGEVVRAGAPQAGAMTLATATPDGHPSARVVLLKRADQQGFVFVSNYASRKGREIEANPRGTLVFHWPTAERQVRVEGPIERTSPGESDALFLARARDHQLSSLASPQSEIITLEELDRRYADLDRTFVHGTVTRPSHWGGYRLVPQRMEFWQHRFARMNDRVLYVREERTGSWSKVRLAP
jgi:pyridoxamine 5'-phosphate oxidase